MDNLEKAALPSVDEEERKKLLSFVSFLTDVRVSYVSSTDLSSFVKTICGGGPTGVEFASELWEMVSEDVNNCMFKLLFGLRGLD